MDAESLHKSDRRRRGSCLDAFLVVSVIFLFVAVTALAAGGVMVVLRLRSELESARPSVDIKMSRLTGDTPAPAYKMENFVHLEATSSELKNSTMPWAGVKYAAGGSVGSNFLFDEEQYTLKARQAGNYFMYIDLNFTCTYTCKAGLLRVHVGDKLTCDVELPEMADETPVSRKCWTVRKLEEDKLVTQMTVPENGLPYWKLELRGSRLGMFLVD